MKRSRSPEESRKRAKLSADCLEEITIFSDLETYPSDLKVIGNSFEIPVHGLLLCMKSQSLKAIICQPGNSIEKIWNLDPEISQNVAVQFLMNFYPNQKPDFLGIESCHYKQYYTLVDMHLSEKEANEFKKFLIGRMKVFNDEYYGDTISDAPASEKLELLDLLNIFCSIKLDRNFTRSSSGIFLLYYLAISINAHLNFGHVEYLLQTFQHRFANLAAMPILLYILMKNNLPFESMDLSKYPTILKFSFTRFIELYEEMVLSNTDDKAKAHELLSKACIWARGKLVACSKSTRLVTKYQSI